MGKSPPPILPTVVDGARLERLSMLRAMYLGGQPRRREVTGPRKGSTTGGKCGGARKGSAIDALARLIAGCDEVMMVVV